MPTILPATDLELAAWERRTRPLGRLIAETIPGHREPMHLAPLLERIEGATSERVRVCVSVPPRHGKTTALVHGIAWWLLRDPTERIAYVSYSSAIAEEKGQEALRVAQECGVQLGTRVTLPLWETRQGGRVVCTGIRNALTSRGFSKVIVDDPIEGHEDAESPTMREKNWHGFLQDIWTRRDPRGTSFFVVQTRWHQDDLAGRLVREKRWPEINLPAIDEAGRALAPELWPLSTLEEIREGTTAYAWSALYQGRPVPRGGAVFGPATYCDKGEIPRDGYRVSFGIDLAYSRKSHADYSTLVVLVRAPTGILYVADVLRMQCEAPAFFEACASRLSAWPGAKGRWYTSTTEKGLADMMAAAGLRLEGRLATADKLVRAQPAAAAWQHGRIRVPRAMPWAGTLVDEVERFTGLHDQHDDQIDALAAAYDELEGSGVASYLRRVGHLQATR